MQPSISRPPLTLAWILVLVLLTLLPRLWLAVATRDQVAADLVRYKEVAEAGQAGRSPLALPPEFYPYPPVWMFFESAALSVSQSTSIPFALAIKLPIIAADVLLTIIIFELTGSVGWALAYALNPLTILVSASLGQFDALAMAPLLVSIVLLDRGKYVAGGLIGGLAAAIKFYPLLFIGLAALYMWRQRHVSLPDLARYVGLSVVVLVLVCVPFLIRGETGYLTRPIAYASATTGTDLGALQLANTLNLPIRGMGDRTLPGVLGTVVSRGVLLAAGKVLLLVIALAGLWYYYFPSSADYLFFFLVAFYAVAGGTSAQYMMWIVPLGCYLARRGSLLFSGFASAAVVCFIMAKYPSLLVPDQPKAEIWVTLAAVSNGLFVAFCLVWLVYIGFKLWQKRPYPLNPSRMMRSST